MGIFDKLFGNTKDNQKSIEINVTKNGIVVNGHVIQLPVKTAILTDIFGEPEQVKTETNLFLFGIIKALEASLKTEKMCMI